MKILLQFILIIIVVVVVVVDSVEQQVTCNAIVKFGNGLNELSRYDCSKRHITWTIMKQKLQQTTHATEINLSNNDFSIESSVIKNYSFDNFVDLIYKLDLSFNKLEAIEEEAFFNRKINSFLKIQTLDLSNNKFNGFNYKALGKLDNLQHLYYGFNDIPSLDFHEKEGEEELTKVQLFQKLKSLHLNNCKIKYLSARLIQFLNVNTLEYLNLAGNEFTALSSDFKDVLPPSIILDVHLNQFECACESFWLKKHLVDIKKKDIKQIQFEDGKSLAIDSEFFNTITCRLDYYEYSTTVDVDVDADVETTNSTELPEKLLLFKNKTVSIITLPDNQFICGLNVTNTKIDVNQYELKIVCDIYGFPKPHIWWLFDQKTINRDWGRDGIDYKIEDKDLTEKNSSIIHFESTLIIFNPSIEDIGTYKCAASFKSLKSSAVTAETTEDDLQKIYNQRLNQTIIIEVPVDFKKHTLIFESNRYTKKQSLINDITKDQGSLWDRHKNLVILVIILAIILLLFVIITVISIVFIRRRRNSTTGGKRNHNNNNRNDTPDSKTPIYESYYKTYDEIQRLKVRQHDGYDYDEDFKYNNYKPKSIRFDPFDEYDTVSKDTDPIDSSIISKSSAGGGINSNDDEDLDEYQDPDIHINLRKPGEIV